MQQCRPSSRAAVGSITVLARSRQVPTFGVEPVFFIALVKMFLSPAGCALVCCHMAPIGALRQPLTSCL